MHRMSSIDENVDLPSPPNEGKDNQHVIKELTKTCEELNQRTEPFTSNQNHQSDRHSNEGNSFNCNSKYEGENEFKSNRHVIDESNKLDLHACEESRTLDFPSSESHDEDNEFTDQIALTDKGKQMNATAKQRKIKQIQKALVHGDSETLQEAAASEWGLVKDVIRRQVWPVLVGVDVFETSLRPSMEEIESHPYYNQVVMDVNRSIKRFPPSIKESERLAMQDQLVLLIMRILLKHSELHYYQGYHDICVTFLLVLGEEIAFTVVDKLSTSHLRVFMDETMERTTEVLHYIYPLIHKESPDLCEFLERSEVGVIFCLSWVITWFGHVLTKYSDVVRLFDFFIISHPWMPLYLTVAIVLYRKEEILQEICDMACVHSLLSHIPDNLPLQNLVVSAEQLFENYPPNLLKKERPLQLRSQLQRRNRRRGGSISLVVSRLRDIIPEPRWTLSLAVATAVVMYAIFYQTCRTAGINMD